jgi:hypothetical protein
MNVFEEILSLPGAALVLADKLSGRIIGRVADGFGDDPALSSMMNLFRTIENKYEVLSLREMHDLQLKDAGKENAASQAALDELTEEQREIWMGEPVRVESRETRLKKVLPKIVDLYAEAEPIAESWDDLTTINQWSLLNATERGLHERLCRYQKWAKEPDNDRAIALRDQADDAMVPLFSLITDFLADPGVAKDLKQDADNGIRVPERRAA